MSQVTRVFKTVGPLAGATVVLAGYQFVKGTLIYTGSESDADGLGLYLHRCWQVEVAPAEEAQEVAPPAPPPPEERPNKSQALGNERLAAALLKLDPENDEHWTKLGKPAMAALEQFYGSADITRADVGAAIPQFDRDVARASKQASQ